MFYKGASFVVEVAGEVITIKAHSDSLLFCTGVDGAQFVAFSTECFVVFGTTGALLFASSIKRTCFA